MHKLVLVSMIVITAATSFAAPSFAQSAGGKGRGGGGGHSSSDSSDWYPGIGSFTHGNDNYNRRRPRVILTKSGSLLR